jgi:hypothetical protein
LSISPCTTVTTATQIRKERSGTKLALGQSVCMVTLVILPALSRTTSRFQRVMRIPRVTAPCSIIVLGTRCLKARCIEKARRRDWGCCGKKFGLIRARLEPGGASRVLGARCAVCCAESNCWHKVVVARRGRHAGLGRDGRIQNSRMDTCGMMEDDCGGLTQRDMVVYAVSSGYATMSNLVSNLKRSRALDRQRSARWCVKVQD